MTTTAPTARILVVDDEEPIRTLLAFPLRRDGHDVVTAASGAEALEEFDRVRPDLVLLDVMLPGIDGFEVCRRLRERSPVPIIMLSARGEEIDRVAGLESRRRRLRDQAVLGPRAAQPGPGGAAPRGAAGGGRGRDAVDHRRATW